MTDNGGGGRGAEGGGAGGAEGSEAAAGDARVRVSKGDRGGRRGCDAG